MKKYIKVVFLLIAIIMVIPSCKKGADDPFLSLRSRKQRITGKWEAIISKREYTRDNLMSIYKSEDGELQYIHDGETKTGTYMFTIEFLKTGKYKIKEIIKINEEDEITELNFYENGNWNFMPEYNGTKSKECVIMQPTEQSINNNQFGVSGSILNQMGYTITLSKLSNSELNFHYTKKTIDSYSNYLQYSDFSFTKMKD